MLPIRSGLALLSVSLFAVAIVSWPGNLLMAQESRESPMSPDAVDVPRLDHQLFLPVMKSDATALDVANANEPTVNAIAAPPKDIPFAQLPECPPIPPIDASKLPPPDDSAPRCRLPSTQIIDVRELLEAGQDPAHFGIGGDPRSETPEAGASAPTPSATPSFSLSPAAAETPVSPAAVDVPRLDHQIYFPVMKNALVDAADSSVEPAR